MTEKLPDAWLRGPVAGVPALLQPAAHAFVQVAEDVSRAAAELPPDALWLRPGGAASAGFHLKHLVGATDRLLTYARGGALSEEQKAFAGREAAPEPGDSVERLADGVQRALDAALEVLRATPPEQLLAVREVGRARLPTTTLGAIFHAAEHAQRHAGQLVTTVKVVREQVSRPPLE